MHPYNFGVSVNILMRLFQPTCREAGVITCVQFSEGPPRRIWEGQKNVQISARFLTTFDFDREYLRNVWAHQKIWKVVDQLQPLPGWKKKPGELWSTYEKVIAVHIDLPKWTFFWGHNISALKGCCALKFLHALESDQGYLAHTPTGTGVSPPPKKKYLIAKI